MKTAAENKNYISALMALLAVGIFAVCVLAVLFAGTESYSSLTERDRQTYEMRTCTGYITTKVRQASSDSVSVESFGGSDAIVIEETLEGDNYKTLIYCWDGWLMEYFADAGSVDMDADMEFGSRLFPVESMSLAVNDGLLRAEVSIGGETAEVLVSVHSGEEASYEK